MLGRFCGVTKTVGFRSRNTIALRSQIISKRFFKDKEVKDTLATVTSSRRESKDRFLNYLSDFNDAVYKSNPDFIETIINIKSQFENKFYFDSELNLKNDRLVMHDLLDGALQTRIEGESILLNIKQRLNLYSQAQLIELMKLETAPNYEGSFEIVVEKTRGPWWIDVDGNFHLNANTSYGAKRYVELDWYNTGDLPSRAVYSLSQLLATLVVNTYGRHAGIADSKSLVLMSGSDVMRAAFDGCERVFNLNCKHIIFKNHFHGRAIFNEWDYSSESLKRSNTIALPFNDSDKLVAKVEDIISRDSKKGIAVYFEPVQGEGGLTPISSEFEQTLMKLKSKYPETIMLIADCVQRGFAGEDIIGLKELVPDAIAFSKAVNNGNYPTGVLVGNSKFMNFAFAPGTHGGTGSLREDGCKSLIDAFEMFTTTNALKKLQSDTNQLCELLQSFENSEFQIKTDKSSMIGIDCKSEALARHYQSKAFNFKDLLDNQVSKMFLQELIGKHGKNLDDKLIQDLKLFFDNHFKSMPIKIAGDKTTLRFSGQMVSVLDMVKIKIILEFVFSKH